MIVCIYFLNNKTILFKNNYLTYKNIFKKDQKNIISIYKIFI